MIVSVRFRDFSFSLLITDTEVRQNARASERESERGQMDR